GWPRPGTLVECVAKGGNMRLRTILAAFAVPIATAAIAAAPAAADYGPGAVYQVEITVNEGGPQGGGIWLWLALYPNGTGDYAGSDCGHGHGAAADGGDVTWPSANGMLTITGAGLNVFVPLGPLPPATVTPEPVYVCSVARIASFSGTPQRAEIDDKDSVQLIVAPVGRQTITVTNPANGKSSTGIGPNSPAGEIIKITNSAFVDHLN